MTATPAREKKEEGRGDVATGRTLRRVRTSMVSGATSAAAALASVPSMSRYCPLQGQAVASGPGGRGWPQVATRSAPSSGSAMTKGAVNMVWGLNPAKEMPRSGLDAGRVRVNASANVSRFSSDSGDGCIAKRREVSSCSLHSDRMAQGSVAEAGGVNVRP